MTNPTYFIFDSYDNRASGPAARSSDHYDQLDRLQREVEDEGSTLTYAIAAVFPDGYVTFDI